MAKVRFKLDPGAEAAFEKMANEYIADTVLPKMVSSAKRAAPVDTGELRDSIHAETGSDGNFLVANADHAAHVELGTSKMAAQPYLRPAINTNLG